MAHLTSKLHTCSFFSPDNDPITDKGFPKKTTNIQNKELTQEEDQSDSVKPFNPVNPTNPDEESGISTPENVKPSEARKDPSTMPLSKEGKKFVESHSGKPVNPVNPANLANPVNPLVDPNSGKPVKPVSSLRSQLERCQKEVKRTISGGNLISKTTKLKEPLVQTKSLPFR